MDTVPAPPQPEGRWEGRPWLARIVRVGVAGAPIGAAVGCSSLVSRALPTPSTTSGIVTWWAFVLVVSTSALVVTDRFARRLLPLSVLLKLSLPFPDAPPSRIKVAIRSGSPRQLEKWADSVAARGRKDPKAVAAHDLLGLVTALSVHDRRSRGHSERVRVYTDLMAEQLDLSRDDADKLRWASLLHDIGKIRVPGEILNKPGAPDAAEWEILRQHPSEGDRLIEPVRAWLGPWSKAVLEHHERWDGNGYPRGLAGHQISLAGRAVAVTDSYEVMTATRSYKKPMSVKAAREELTRSAGTHFDPAMVRAFLSMPIRRVGWAAGPIAWLAQLPSSPRFQPGARLRWCDQCRRGHATPHGCRTPATSRPRQSRWSIPPPLRPTCRLGKRPFSACPGQPSRPEAARSRRRRNKPRDRATRRRVRRRIPQRRRRRRPSAPVDLTTTTTSNSGKGKGHGGGGGDGHGQGQGQGQGHGP